MATNHYKLLHSQHRLCYLHEQPGQTQKFCRGSTNQKRNQNTFQNPRGCFKSTGGNYGPSIRGRPASSKQVWRCSVEEMPNII